MTVEMESVATVGTGETVLNKFLSFRLGAEEYGVEILRVREIIGVLDITPLPQTPDYVQGVINLRGKIIPVIDLRRRFLLETKEFTDQTCIIVIEMPSTSGDTTFELGIIVDSVCEVIDVAGDMIEPTPQLDGSIQTGHLSGIAKVKDRVIALLDIDGVLPSNQLTQITSAASGVSNEEPTDAASNED